MAKSQKRLNLILTPLKIHTVQRIGDPFKERITINNIY